MFNSIFGRCVKAAAHVSVQILYPAVSGGTEDGEVIPRWQAECLPCAVCSAVDRVFFKYTGMQPLTFCALCQSGCQLNLLAHPEGDCLLL